MSTPSLQWKRVAQVVIGSGGNGLLVQSLRIDFEITKHVEATPNEGVIKIYNLLPDNENKIKNEYDEVLVNAGYQDSVRLIFRGNIKHVFRYRKGNDYITEIEAADGDADYRRAFMNEALAAGTTVNQLVDRAVSSFGTTIKGHVQVTNHKHIRGIVVSGNTRDVLTNVARKSGANWSIQDGQLHIVKVDSVLPDEAIVVNIHTGLLTTPEVSDKGIKVKCLLNPQIRVNGTIKLDNNNIKLRIRKQHHLGKNVTKKTQTGPVRLDPDGLYKVIWMEHSGDTRGNDWTTEMVCIGLSQPIPATNTYGQDSQSAEVEDSGI